MGWKISTIIINSNKEINELDLLESLGFKNTFEIKSEVFEDVMNPDDNKVYIGKYKGNLIICAQEFPTSFFNGIILKGEKMLTSFFPDTEICALVLHSAVNFWGYSISKNNKKIRVRAGSAEAGTFIEYGEPIEEEKALFAMSEITHGKRLFHFDDMPDEYFTDDQVGENFVFDISKRYLGEQLDASEELFETELKGFQFTETAFNQINKDHKKERKWVKYVFVLAFIILFKVLKSIFFKD